MSRFEGISVSRLQELLQALRDQGLPGDTRVNVKEGPEDWESTYDVLDVTAIVTYNEDEAGPVKQLIIQVGHI